MSVVIIGGGKATTAITRVFKLSPRMNANQQKRITKILEELANKLNAECDEVEKNPFTSPTGK